MLSIIDWKTDLDFTGVLAWLVVYTGLVAGLGSDFCTGLVSGCGVGCTSGCGAGCS